MATLSERDDAEWHALGRGVARRIEGRLDPRSAGNRWRRTAVGWGPEGLGRALLRRRRMERALGGGPILRTDVASFYPSVTPVAVFEALVRLGADPDEASGPASLLEAWGSGGYAGLPIGPPSSALVANAVLAPVDELLASRRFVRWVDDLLVAVRSERDATLVLEAIDERLHLLGLCRNLAKTSLVEPTQGARIRVSGVSAGCRRRDDPRWRWGGGPWRW